MQRLPERRSRNCDTLFENLCVDLDMAPPCQSGILPDQLNAVEHPYPLRVQVCRNCFFVRPAEYVSRDERYSEYAYFFPLLRKPVES